MALSKWLTGYSGSASGSQLAWDPLDIRGMVAGGGAPSQKASETFAALTRQQWDDYLRNFVPLENIMIDYATNPQTVNDAVMQARTDVGNSFDAQQGINERRLRGFGLSLDADEQRAADRSMGLAKSLADVSAANMTTQRVTDRQRSLLGNPAPNIRTE
jgi:hypothetical protein